MSTLRGTGVSPGIAVGRALVMERDAAPVFRLAIDVLPVYQQGHATAARPAPEQIQGGRAFVTPSRVA